MNQLNRSLDCAKQLNKYLLNLDVIKEYQKYEQLIHQDDKIEKLEAKIEEYQKIKDEFENHPLVVNYLYLKEEVDSLLQSINTYINGQLLK